MVLLEISYNDDSQKLVKQLQEELTKFKDVELKSYHEELFKERKKSFKLKGAYGTRLCPFALLSIDGSPIKAFYSDTKQCTVKNIINSLGEFLPYD